MRYVNLYRNLRNWPRYLGVKYGLDRNDPLRFETRSGVRIEVPRSLISEFKEIFMSEAYGRSLRRPLPPRPTIVDIGANVGFFSLFAAHRYPDARIVALEPLPVNFSQLQRHRDLNPHIRLECLAMAASGTEGSLVLNVNRNDHFTTSASIQTGRWSRRDTVQVNVPSMPLPRLFEFRRIERCDLLKLDCEGAEFDLLYLCPRDTLDRIDRIAMEVHEGTGGDQTPEAMERFLEDVGFSVERKGSGPLSMLWAERASVQ